MFKKTNESVFVYACFVFFLKMMNNMGGEDDLPDVDGADDVSEICLL